MSSKKDSSHFEKPLYWTIWFGIIFLIIISVAWLSQAPTREEAFGDTGKIWDVLHASIGGWTPNFMLGHSLMTLQVAGLGFVFSCTATALFAEIIGALSTIKLVALMYIIASGYGMYLLLRKMKAGASIASLGALFYIILPMINVRLGIYEHLGVGLCFVFCPLLLRGIIAVSEEGSPREIVGLGLSAGALALSYTKIAFLMAPLLLLWTIEVLRQNPSQIRRSLIGYGFSVLVAILTAVLILLPGYREFGIAAGFLFDPVDGWKHHYAFKTPLLWIDLWGFLAKGSPELIGDAQMFQIGLIPLIGLSITLAHSSLADWRATQLGRWFLILTGCWLISIWFASGPDGIFLGHLNTLKTSQGIPDTSIPILWISLIWIGWMIYRTAIQLLPKNKLAPAIITLVVMLTPIFRLAELLPLFNDVRAPESYWSVGGYCCLSAAVGISFWVIFTEIVSDQWRKPLAIAVSLLLLLELYPIHSIYWTRGMDRQLFKEYDQATEFLKTAPLQGRVHPLSGRYFYLTLPEKSGRAVDSESLHRHFQLKWVRHLEAAGNASGDTLRSYLNLVGVAYILLDKEDPFSPKQMQDFFRSVYPVVFENRYFAVLANPGTLYPAFLAHDFVALPPDGYALAPAALQLLPKNLITVETSQAANAIPGFAGQANGANQLALLPQYQTQNGQPFARVPLVGNRMDDYEQMTYQVPADASGWLVVSEAYHPDWTVTIDGRPAQTTRAEAALLGTYVPTGSHEVTFSFKAPAWYSLSMNLGIFFWVIALVALVYLPSKWAPVKWRDWWCGRAS